MRTAKRNARPQAVRVPSRGAALVRAVLAGIGLIILVVGTPLLLPRLPGVAFPQHVPSWTQFKTALVTRDDGHLFLSALKDLGWVSWATFTILAICETVAELTGRTTPNLSVLGPAQWLARLLVASVIAVILSEPTALNRATAAPPPLAATALPTSALPQALADQTPAAPSSVRPSRTPPDHAYKIYTVRRRDTLWSIAERQLGDGECYQQIAELNYGRPQPDGRTLTSAHWVFPGWQLLLPAAEESPPPTDVHHGDDQHRPGRTGADHLRYTVRHGDTLWDIARRHLAVDATVPDIADLMEKIYHLNRGHQQPDGGRLIDRDLIRPGWHLLLPANPEHRSTHHDAAPSPPPPHRQHGATPHPPASNKTATPPAASAHPPPRTQPAASHHSGEHEHGPSTVISLSSGALVGASLAGSIGGTAILLMRLHRRRRYRPASRPGSSPPDPPLSPTLKELRRAHITATHDPEDTDRDETPRPPARPGPSTPELPAYAPRDDFPIATRSGREVLINLPALHGLGLEGAGAEDAARAVLAAIVAIGNPNDTEILIPDEDLQRLTGIDPAQLPTPPALIVTASLEKALGRIEAELVHRTRLLVDYDIDDFTTLRERHPDEPLPTLILIATPTPHAAQQLTTDLMSGSDRGIGAVLLGPSPSGLTCHIDVDGRITATAGTAPGILRDGQLFHLPPADITDLLAVLAAAQGHEQQPQSPPDHPTPEPDKVAATTSPPQTDPLDQVPQPPPDTPPVRLTVFGHVRVYVDGKEIETGLRSNARAALALLAAHPDGVTLAGAVATMWPDTEPKPAAINFRAAVGNARKVLRDTTGATQASFITYTGEKYRLDPQLIDVDLWHFKTSLNDAANATDNQTKRVALAHATELYEAGFAQGHTGRTFEWTEPLRESLHRSAVDAFARLAELENPEPEHALTTLERAIEHDHYNEDLYRRAILLQAELGRPDAIRRTYQLLHSRLAQIDADPDSATEHLVANLLHRLKTHQRRRSPAQGAQVRNGNIKGAGT